MTKLWSAKQIRKDGEVPQMTTSPRIREDLAPGTGPQYRSLLCLSRKNRTSSPLQVLNFRELVWTSGTVLPVLPIPWHWWGLSKVSYQLMTYRKRRSFWGQKTWDIKWFSYHQIFTVQEMWFPSASSSLKFKLIFPVCPFRALIFFSDRGLCLLSLLLLLLFLPLFLLRAQT